jgi:glycine/D-amino acid oxidase-like deaminating enzyme
MHDAIVIGGGFYGATLAAWLARRGDQVVLLEREAALMQRASARNQARIHNGYHYPRSFTTARRSRVNLQRFLQEHPDCVHRDFVALYAVARRNSRVTARQFVQFCRRIGARVEPAPRTLHTLFAPRLIEDVFVVEEYVFDTQMLAGEMRRRLEAAGVEVRLGAGVTGVTHDGASLKVRLGGETEHTPQARRIFNCSYSGLNHLGGGFPRSTPALKHELAELALLRLPESLRRLAVTVIDGPFFSLQPWPCEGLHTLSHVRYTPHFGWLDSPQRDPFDELASRTPESRHELMLRDARRYLPSLADADYVRSLYEIKTVLARNESDDGRPILLEEHVALPGFVSVLGGKIDNVYDVLERL